jgi:hypothetical protein
MISLRLLAHWYAIVPGVFIIRSIGQYCIFSCLHIGNSRALEKRAKMMSQSRVNAIRKLAAAGEHAGFSLEQMIQLLNSGMSVVALLDLINWRLDPAQSSSSQSVIPTCWSHVVRQSARSQSD